MEATIHKREAWNKGKLVGQNLPDDYRKVVGQAV